LERVDHSELDPTAEVEMKAARKAIIKVCALFPIKISLTMDQGWSSEIRPDYPLYLVSMVN
jgi:hypothetical protein